MQRLSNGGSIRLCAACWQFNRPNTWIQRKCVRASQEISMTSSFLASRRDTSNEDFSYGHSASNNTGKVPQDSDLIVPFGLKIDSESYASLLQHCANFNGLEAGRRIHSQLVGSGNERDLFLGNHLANMYGKCGALEEASAAFDMIAHRNVFSWNILIGAYGQKDQRRKAFDFFKRMHLEGVMPDKVTFVILVSIIDDHATLPQGKQIHSIVVVLGLEPNVVVGTALVNMYGKCDRLQDAHRLFDTMPKRNVISWTALIAAYAQRERSKEALELFYQMEPQGLVPGKITFVSVLSACATAAAFTVGRDIHSRIMSSGFEADTFVGTALVNMYVKCGNLACAQDMFHRIYDRNVLSWTALIEGYALFGLGKQALCLFHQMQLEGVVPDKVTFFSILCACSHVGLLEAGIHLFESMVHYYRIIPALEHFNCMVDLLGRMGRLDEGENLITSMSVQPNSTSWMTLLSACKMHLDLERAKRTAECIFELDSENADPYVLLSNIHAASGQWDDSAKMQTTMKDKGLKRQTCIIPMEIGNRVREFIVDNFLYPQKEEICIAAQILSCEMEVQGFVPYKKVVTHDVTEEKECMHYSHRKKLAVAYGLISRESITTLSIIENVSVCPDCHSTSKFISNIAQCKIVMRGANGIHHFQNGVCSCSDSW